MQRGRPNPKCVKIVESDFFGSPGITTCLGRYGKDKNGKTVPINLYNLTCDKCGKTITSKFYWQLYDAEEYGFYEYCHTCTNSIKKSIKDLPLPIGSWEKVQNET